MTEAEAIRELVVLKNIISVSENLRLAIDMAVAALQKENEPAPSANDTSSEENYLKNNDTTEKAKCQENINIPEKLSEDLFRLIFDCVQNMIIACVRHGIHDTKKISRVVFATIETSEEMFFESEEDRQC